MLKATKMYSVSAPIIGLGYCEMLRTVQIDGHEQSTNGRIVRAVVGTNH